MSTLLSQAHDVQLFRTQAQEVIELIARQLEQSQTAEEPHTLHRVSPEEQLRYWQEDFDSAAPTDLPSLLGRVMERSANLHSRGYMAHQVPATLPLTALTSALTAFMNNVTTVYEMGMTGNAMEKVVTRHLARKFGYGEDASGIVTSGGSLGNLTALLAAKAACAGNTDSSRLAIMVSDEAHYSIERAAKVMGIPDENVIKVPTDDAYRLRTELLAPLLQQATAEGKKVFCIVGCASSTSTGSYDNLEAIGAFARQHGLWFHTDGAHGAAVVFSDTHRPLLKGIEQADSIVLDFHKMMLAPALSTAVLFRSHQKAAGAFAPKAQYLWHNQQTDEWYNSAKHTFECTKPQMILHTYAIMRLYGDRIYQEHVDKLYGLAARFADMLEARSDFELAVRPESNIVCFRCLAEGRDGDALNQKIAQALMDDGRFYIVSTTLKGKFYLRVSLMNPMAGERDLEALLAALTTLMPTTRLYRRSMETA